MPLVFPALLSGLLLLALPVPYNTAAAVAAVCLPSRLSLYCLGLLSSGLQQVRHAGYFLIIGKNVCVEIAFPVESKRV